MLPEGHPAAPAAVGVLILLASACGNARLDGMVGEPSLQQTLRLVAEERPFRPHFTGIGSHAACPGSADDGAPRMRCRPIGRQTLRRAARIAVRLRGERTAGEDDPDRVRAASLLTLFSPDPASGVTHAVERLAAARRRHTDSPELANDLAALLLVRAELLDSPADNLSALRHATEALELRRPFPEAETNRALALEALALWSASAEAWRRAGREAGLAAGWSEEARAGRRRCETRARRPPPHPDPGEPHEGRPASAWVRRDPYAARRYTESRIGRWASLREKGRTREADAALASAGAVAELLARRTGDRLYVESVRHIDQASRGAADGLSVLAAGHAAFDAARAGGIYSDCALPALARAEEALTRAGTPFRGWALLDGAICAYFAKDFQRAETKLDEIARLTRSGAYPTLEGRRAWILALIRLVQGRYDEALDSLRLAIERFEKVGEQENVTNLYSMVAKTYRYLGAHEPAWRYRMRALRGRGRLTSPERTFTLFEEAVEALRAEPDGREALYFLAEQLAAAEQGARDGDWDLVVYTLLDRREVLLGLRRTAAADADLAGAERAWSRLPHGHESRERLRLELDLHRAAADHDDPAHLAAIRRGLEFFQRDPDVPGDRIQVVALHRAAAAVHRRRGDLAAAERSLLTGLAEAETQRSRLMVPELRASFLDEMRDLGDQMIEAQLDARRDPWRALEFVERASNRVLLDLLAQPRNDDLAAPGTAPRNGAASGPDSGHPAADRLPEGTVVVRYGRLGDRLLVWVLSREGSRFEERDVSRRYLADRLASLRHLLREPRAAPLLDAVLAELGGAILPDDLWRLPSGSHVAVVPEDSTAGIPFAALRDAADRRYLGERLAISVAPSLDVYLETVERGDAWTAPTAGSVLVVADPRFDRDLFPSLGPLPAARAAGPGLRKLHPGATLLTGADATEPALASAMADHRIFHFEGHALSDPANGARSALLLAPADPARPERETSLLRADELSGLDLGHLRLIVLAACSTAVGLYPDSREVASLATSFLAAGSPAVVASLWNVDDAESAALFHEFHRSLAAGSPPAYALQQAQASLRRRGDRLSHPASWAGFELFGHGGYGRNGNSTTESVH